MSRRPASPQERQARRRASIAAAGGRVVTVVLAPDAAAKLQAWVASGTPAGAALNRLLAESRPPAPATPTED